MDRFNLFKGYGKVDDDHLEDQAPEANRKPLLAFIFVSTVFCVILTIGITVAAVIPISKTEPPETQSAPSMANAAAIKTVCNVTRFPASCFSSISSLSNSPQNPGDPESILKLSLQVSLNELSNLSSFLGTMASTSNGPALPDCRDQIDDALSRLNDSLSAMEVVPGDKALTDAKINDIQTWLSAAVTDQETCVDGLEEMKSRAAEEVKGKMQRLKEYTSNSLAIVANMRTLLQHFNMPLH